MKTLSKIFEPINIGSLEIKNRIVMPPMSTNFANEDGSVSERQIRYYEARAIGGVGLIIVEATCIESSIGKLNPIQLCIDNDKFIAGLNELAEAITRYGARAAIQLHHAGRRARVTNGKQPVSASDGLSTPIGLKTRALTLKEIEELIELFAKAAERAKIAGFEAIELHGAHGYLIGQFLSPLTNRRTDKYGGDINGRARFAIEIVRRIKEKLGENFPLIFRISGDEYINGGLDIEETKIISKLLEKEGVNALHISAGAYETRHWTSAPMCIPRGHLVYLAEKIKQIVNIPVITVGRINDLYLAEDIIKNKKADLVSMGRALIADPEIINKTLNGKIENIRRCIACNRCLSRLDEKLHISCTVNPIAGKEYKIRVKKASKPKKVLIIGGGPAGMEAARIAAIRGHEVILYEEKDKLGGQLILATIPPHKEEMKSILEYYTQELSKLEIEIKIGRKATLKDIEKISPEIIILATGAKPIIPSIPGIKNKNVITAWDVLLNTTKVGDNVVIIGGGMVGCETAEYLIKKGKKVKIIEMLPDIAVDVEFRSRTFLLERLHLNKVDILVNTELKEVMDNKAILINKKGEKIVLEADNIVLACGSKPNNELAKIIKPTFKKVYEIGDCKKPRKVLEAIHEGFHIGNLI
ncbi:MAG: FAD-dependent oxidoreductase [Nitrososphaerota archaeon]